MADLFDRATWYRKRREAGLCRGCKLPACPGKANCAGCAAKAAAAKKRYVQKRRQAGLCRRSGCQNRPVAGRTVCATCAGRDSKSSLRRYYRNKEAGVCRYCGGPSGGRHRCEGCDEYYATYQSQWYEQRKADGLCVNCGKPLTKADVGYYTHAKCRAHAAVANKARHRSDKLAAIAMYGGAICANPRCGETDVDVLEIDHIAGGGTAHRRQIGMGELYAWLRRNNYPPGFRVLCPTCNRKAYLGKLKL